MTANTFYIDSMLLGYHRGYHNYQSIWDNHLTDGDLIPCEREIGNSHNLQAMAIKKTTDGTLQVFGRVSRKISSI